MSNPVISRAFNDNDQIISANPMTIQGTVNKLFVMTAILTVAFGVVFSQYALGFMDKVSMLTTIGAIGGLVLALVIIFTRKAMNVLVPLYAFCEGAALGGISAVANAAYPGIVPQTVALTLLALFSLLGLYKAGAIRATDKFRATIFTATLAIGIFYLVAFILSFFGVSIPVLYSTNMFSIGFSVVVVGIAALNLILDFDFIEHGALRGLDKDYEWYGAFGLMVTLVWLYIEILRLLSKVNSNR